MIWDNQNIFVLDNNWISDVTLRVKEYMKLLNKIVKLRKER